MPKLRPSDPEEKSQFESAMRPESLFPYGGGSAICSGRFFAKQEILAAVVLIVLKFEIEPRGWFTHHGKKSIREAKPDEGFAGAGVLPPDQDMLVTLRVK
ncbi:uncharacterized protein BP5553_04369 [Venustampulla echinocandica]|uniref:Cytochrome P450 n=1 Tax=Venustampulla echinocandica TaxID=2656787 RepID=A0A370TN36_9HELO|nr:uncharacterized protein BP5553_04369 [Venustampulla echinocandica]RDL36936.1 hypothetical protein BP5553_04369 [Venustampulla echinocandica]